MFLLKNDMGRKIGFFFSSVSILQNNSLKGEVKIGGKIIILPAIYSATFFL